LISARNQESDRLLEHVREALQAYLSGDYPSLDAAFGIARSGAGRPANDESKAIQIACEFLGLRIAGLSYAKAVKKSGYPRNTVTKAWSKHRWVTFISILRERADEGRTWTDEEKSRLNKIFKNKDGG
jgi:hypothetical protein